MTAARVWAMGLALGLCGCGGPVRESREFPATWPGSQPLEPGAPRVQVLPIQMVSAAAAPVTPLPEGLPTAAVLSALFVKHLHVNGVNAALDLPPAAQADYLLQCTVPQLKYDTVGDYPKTTRYQAELACLLLDAKTQQSVWQRSLRQDYETTSVMNLMTHLPLSVHRDERIMYRECIVPLWDAMAQSVGTVVLSRQQPPATTEVSQAP